MGPTKPSGRDAGVADGLDQAAEPLELLMLGPLEAWRGPQRLVLGGQRQRSVLACLMLDPGRDVSADRIIDAIWGERPPSGVLTTLQTYVFHLREVIEPSRGKGAPARVVVTVPGGYRLDTAHATLDAERFETLSAPVAQHCPTTHSAPRRSSPTRWRCGVATYCPTSRR